MIEEKKEIIAQLSPYENSNIIDCKKLLFIINNLKKVIKDEQKISLFLFYPWDAIKNQIKRLKREIKKERTMEIKRELKMEIKRELKIQGIKNNNPEEPIAFRQFFGTFLTTNH